MHFFKKNSNQLHLQMGNKKTVRNSCCWGLCESINDCSEMLMTWYFITHMIGMSSLFTNPLLYAFNNEVFSNKIKSIFYKNSVGLASSQGQEKETLVPESMKNYRSILPIRLVQNFRFINLLFSRAQLLHASKKLAFYLIHFINLSSSQIFLIYWQIWRPFLYIYRPKY